MAKYENTLKSNAGELMSLIENGILSGSVSASLEDQSDYEINGVKIAVRVFERYSMLGQNRVSLNVTLVGAGEDVFVSAIASGGSQAVLYKFNTFGESAFLQQLIDIVEKHKTKRG